MSHITTYTGVRMYPAEPKTSDFHIEDIAHALSLMTRANGHFETFYSVAQHCIACTLEARARGYSKRVQLGCLLHDASEAYISDITRPVKTLLPKYLEVESKLQNMIWEKWLGSPLSSDEYKQVFEIDDAMLYFEFMHFTGEQVIEEQPPLLAEINYDFKDFLLVEDEYLKLFNQLTEC